MIGSPLLAGLVARWGFWVLIAIAYWRGELSLKTIGMFLALWLAGYVGLRTVMYGGLFVPFVALLDIALVFAIFKGDVKLF